MSLRLENLDDVEIREVMLKKGYEFIKRYNKNEIN